MTTTFPGTSIDTYTHPNPNDPRSGATSLSTEFSNIQDAVVALETKVGINSSADNTSQDYKLSGVATGDKAVSKTGTETLTAKTLTAPKINIGGDATGDIYYRDSGGNFQRLAAPTDGSIISYSGGIPVGIPNPAASDASTTVKGVVEIATQTEADAGTAAGGTTAPLVTRTSNVRGRNFNDYVVDTGSATAYAIAPSPAITAYAAGQEFTFKAATTNTTTTPTLNVNAIGAKTLVRPNGDPLGVGDITLGGIYKTTYDGTNFQLVAGGTKPLYNFGQTLRASSSGTGSQTIAHGLGITPKLFKVSFFAGDASNGSRFHGSGAVKAAGSELCSYWLTANASSNAGQAATLISAIDGSSTNFGTASVTSIDATNVTLNWTSAVAVLLGGGTRNLYIQWEAFA